jgi:hypothetical protein
VQRAHASFIALLRDSKGASNVVTLASAGTVDIGGANSYAVDVTGTTSITSFGANFNGPRYVRFTGALTLTHNATLLNLPGAANITTAAGDSLIATPNSTANGWNVTAFTRAASLPASAGANSDILSVNGLTSAVRQVRQIQPIGASVAANALTISASALSLEFRSATLGSGAVSFVQGTPANLVISSGSTLGTTNATQSRIAVLALNNAGTIELAAVNIAGLTDISETGLISTTAEGGAGAADSATVIYSTTARTSVPYRVIGYIESTQATAGTWATAPSTIQGMGGRVLSSQAQGIGDGQTWQSFTVGTTRVNGTTYTNSTGRTITVMVQGYGINGTVLAVINGINFPYVGSSNGTTGAYAALSVPIPNGNTYAFNGAQTWLELR